MSSEENPANMASEASASSVASAKEIKIGSEINAPNASCSNVNTEASDVFSDKDPEALLRLIGKYVKVQLIRNHSYVGFIYAICPFTHSVLLSAPKDGDHAITLLPGTSIMSMSTEAQDCATPPPILRESPEPCSKDVQARRRKVVSWLKENLIPVAVNGENIVFGGITIIPPYTDKDISTNNPLIALEIKKIMDRMPVDYKSEDLE